MTRPQKDRFSQVAALPYRLHEGEIEVLLVTSRATRRWLIPKGWPMKGKKPHKAAAQEAFEEAGVKGSIAVKPLGHYDYWKRRTLHFDLCRVDVYPLEVSKQAKKWPEMAEREAQWFPVAQAARQVLEPALAALIQTLPGKLRPDAEARTLPALVE